MVTFGCVAKLLRSFQCSPNMWVQTVNPGWYSAREIPKTLLIEKVRNVAKVAQGPTKARRQIPKTAEPHKKPVEPVRYPFV
ncbi:hypothetical protein KR009_006790 [Drosophila setifemur]|nr:hypothetical protein KR009_006790 [Drosophila setifemur]